MNCIACGIYFKPSIYSATDLCLCDDCYSAQDHLGFIAMDEISVEMNHILNPTGKVKAMIYEDRESI